MEVNYFCSATEAHIGFRESRKIVYFTIIPASPRLSASSIWRCHHMPYALDAFVYSARLRDAKSLVLIPIVLLSVDQRVCTKLFPFNDCESLHSIMRYATLRLEVSLVVQMG